MIAQTVRHEIDHLPLSLRDGAGDIWQAVADTGSIVGITALFGASLKHTQEVSEEVGIAHFYMWMAYTLYDRALDDGAIADLPVANVFQRAALAHAPGFGDAFLKMDAANSWELRYTRANVTDGGITIGRLPDYSGGMVLAERAWGHISTCIELVPAHTALVSRALSQYVIARQVNDDLHDWVDDLGKGHLSYVVTALLRAGGVKPGNDDLSRLLPNLKRLFWQTELEKLCMDVMARIQAAQTMLRPLMVPDGEFDRRVLQPVWDVAHRALKRHHADKQLLADFRAL